MQDWLLAQSDEGTEGVSGPSRGEGIVFAEEETGPEDLPQPVDSTLRQYMKEVNEIPLLSHEETVELFRSMEAKQRSLDELSSAKVDGSDDGTLRRALQQEISDIKEQLVTANLRLVVFLANRYQGRGVAIQDLVQEGNIGLIRAIDKFDYHLGYRFSTYATWWIRQGMLRAIQQHGRLIRIPSHMLEKFHHQVRSADAARGRVQGASGEPPEAEKGDRPEQEIHLLMDVMRDPISLDAPVTDDGLDLEEIITDEEARHPEDELIEEDLRRKLRTSLTNLPLREEVILRMRYGIDLPDSHTLEEVGQLFKLTKERIRQIEARALRRLHTAYAS